MNTLHTELILHITDFLNPKQIVLLSRVNKDFNKLDANALIIKHNNKKFPHPEGHAKRYKIKYSDCAINSIYDENEIKEKITRAVHRHYNDEIDLVKGNVFWFDEYSPTGSWQGIAAIFDGERMIAFLPDDTYLTLPSSLHVIENNIPIDYWDIQINNHWKQHKIDCVVWFDHNLVKQQCLDNIKACKILSTSFMFNENQYQIIVDLNYKNDDIKLFMEKLTCDASINFFRTGIVKDMNNKHIIYTRDIV